MAAAFLVMDW